ncbi:hypothetical protein CRUP_006957, partial [Coryphaenoides rupestris]
MGRCLGVKNRQRREMVRLMVDCGRTQRQIQRWFRLRRNQDRPSNAKKFGEAAWRFCFYLIAFLAGLACVIDPMERAHYWYYMLELGFYCSLLMRISVDVKRKVHQPQNRDFTTSAPQAPHKRPMPSPGALTLLCSELVLLSFSYCANYIRIGTLVMLLHDSSDILL